MDIENKLVEILTRMERVTAFQEKIEDICKRRLERIREHETRDDDLEKRILILEKQAATLGEMFQAHCIENIKLYKLIKSMVVLLILTLIILSFVGVEAFPFLFEIIKKSGFSIK